MSESKIILSSSTSTDNSKCIKRLFTRFAAIYGHIWKSLFKDDKFFDFTKKEWADALKEFSDNTIERATNDCREFHELPPTLPQMIHCCRSIVNRQFIRPVERPRKPANREFIALQLKKCRESLYR